MILIRLIPVLLLFVRIHGTSQRLQSSRRRKHRNIAGVGLKMRLVENGS